MVRKSLETSERVHNCCRRKQQGMFGLRFIKMELKVRLLKKRKALIVKQAKINIVRSGSWRNLLIGCGILSLLKLLPRFSGNVKGLIKTFYQMLYQRDKDYNPLFE